MLNIFNISSSLHSFLSYLQWLLLLFHILNTSIQPVMEYFYTVVSVLLCKYRTWKPPQLLHAFFKSTIFPFDTKWSPSKKHQKIGRLPILKVTILLLIFHTHFAHNPVHNFYLQLKKLYCTPLKDKYWSQYACQRYDNLQINDSFISWYQIMFS